MLWLLPLEAEENPEALLDEPLLFCPLLDELLLIPLPELDELPLLLLLPEPEELLPLLLPLPELDELPLLLPPLPPTKVHVPPAHSKPVQQSSVVVQLWPLLWQTPPPLEEEPEPPGVHPASQARQPRAPMTSRLRFVSTLILALLATPGVTRRGVPHDPSVGQAEPRAALPTSYLAGAL